MHLQARAAVKGAAAQAADKLLHAKVDEVPAEARVAGLD